MGKIKKHLFGAIIAFVICEIICSEAQISCPTTACSCEVTNNRSIINCREKSLTQIPIFIITGIEYDELTFSTAYPTASCAKCNKITSIPARSFANLRVKRIDLTRNALANISNDSFVGVELYLKELLLEGNKIMEPNYAALNILTGLTSLYLENFQQAQLKPNNSFGSFPNLESLTLKSFITLSLIESTTFQNKMPKLTQLMLEESPLLIYPAGAFLKIPSLQKLIFRSNQAFTQLHAYSFEDLHYLTELDLSHNSIESIHNNTFIGITDTLKVLNLDNNKLGSIRQENLTFLSSKNWTRLEQLSLSYNQLNALPDGTFQTMPNLTYLTLEENNISRISSGLLLGLRNLHTMAVSYNRITDISVSAFVHTPQLTEFRLEEHNDYIQNIALNFPPAAVSSIRTSLVHLNLDQKLVNESQIWEIVQLLINLEDLKLQNTGLVTVPDFVFRYNTKLQLLDLSFNKLTSVNQKSFHGLKDSLTTLSLSYNNLITIDECVFKNFSKLKYLYLAENKWNCDCHLLWLYEWIQMRNLYEPGIADTVNCVCHSPPKLNNSPIKNVNQSDLLCTPAYIPNTCPDYYITTTTTTTPKPLPVFKIASTEALIFSINVSWMISDMNDVTGYLLSLVDLQNTGSRSLSKLPRNATFFQFIDLKPQQAYNICLQVELNNVLNPNLFSCVTNSTKPFPTFDLFPNIITESYIKVRWNVSDMTELTGFRLSIVLLGNTIKNYKTVEKDVSTLPFNDLKSGTFYEICLELIINRLVYEQYDKCKTISTLETNTTQPNVTSEPQTSNLKIPIIVGSIVGAVLFIVIVAIIVYILIRRTTPDKKYMNTEPALGRFEPHELPQAGQTTRTFTKSKPGAAKVDDIQVKVISNGNVNDTRISGGSYQFLNERDSRNVNPLPSTSNVDPHYINDIRSRMLPNPPGKGFQAPHPHAYVNTGYDPQYDNQSRSSDPKKWTSNHAKGASENLKARGSASKDSKPNPDSIYNEIDLNASAV